MDEVHPEHRRTRGALALGIVVGGVALALMLGSPNPPREVLPPDGGASFVLQRRAGASTLESPAKRKGDAAALGSSPFSASLETTVAVQGDKSDVLPPALAKSFPGDELPVSARWGVSLGIGMAGTSVVGPSARTHRIVNGDSLPALAKRYLGSENRAGEMFEANRDLLASPDALPIGIELRIPARDAVRVPVPPASCPPALVPIAPKRSHGQDGACGNAS